KVRSTVFRDWLTREYLFKTGAAPNNNAMEQALRTAEAKRRFSSHEQQVFVRVGRVNGAIYVDLADADWQAIKIEAHGWIIDRQPSVRFVRPEAMLPLPRPVKGGSISKLRGFINVRADDDFFLVVAWLLAALRKSRRIRSTVKFCRNPKCRSK